MSHPFHSVTLDEAIARVSFLIGDDISRCKLSLKDPATGRRIKVPGRGMLCDHIDVVDVLESVDLDDSLQADGQLDPSWMCPVCGKEYDHVDSIEVDGLVEEILAEVPETVDTVVVNTTGEWDISSPDDEVSFSKRKIRDFEVPMQPIIELFEVADHASTDDDEPSNPKRTKFNQPDEVIDLDDE